MKLNRTNLVDGVIWRSLALFALPLLLSNFLQQLYNTADLLIVGRFAGSHAMGSVGAIGSVTGMLIGLAVGLATGCTVVVSQYFGAEDYDGLYKTVHTAMAIALAGGLILTVAGIGLAPVLLRWMNTPPELLPGAITYMRIYFAGIIPTLIYNMGAGILNAVGDSKSPFFFLVVSAVTNISFDLLFVAVFRWGVAGAALATVIAQIVAAALVLISLTRTDSPYRVFLKDIRMHLPILKKVSKVGLPAGTQSVLVSLANTFIQVAINGFGAKAVAGVAVANRVDGFIFVVMNAIGLSVMTFTGQNIGAGKPDRVRRGLYTGVAMVVGMALALGWLVLGFAPDIVSLFNDDPAVSAYTIRMMRFILPFYFLFGVNDVIGGFLRGRGKSLVPMIVSLVFMTGFRLLWIWLVTPVWSSIDVVFMAYPISWVLTFAVLFVYLLKTYGLRSDRQEEKTLDPL